MTSNQATERWHAYLRQHQNERRDGLPLLRPCPIPARWIVKLLMSCAFVLDDMHDALLRSATRLAKGRRV